MSRQYVSPAILSHHKLEKDDFNPLFYTPRTLTTAIMVLVVLNILAYKWCDSIKDSMKNYYFDPKNPDVFENYRWPVFFAYLTLIAFASTNFPDTMVRRPHPAFWRIVLGLLLGYSLFMTFILLLPRDEARQVFKIFHPSFGNPLPERSYADDCRVYTPENPISNYYNIYDAVFDVHFIAHLGGWWFKMMIIRDTKIAWLVSLSFELIEISFRHWLLNFWECWWDHVSSIANHSYFPFLKFSYSWTFLDATCLELF